VFLIEPEPTPYDLRWTMFGIPVRVHPMFWVVCLFLGWPSIELGFAYLFVWVACVFVSILVHEMGHVLAGRLFGRRGQIVLYSFGGLAVGSSDLPRRWQRVVVYFAGPGAGFLFYGLVWLVGDPDSYPPLAGETLLDLRHINLYWGLLNLLPIWPLDGGRISYDVLDGLFPRNGRRMALTISMVVAAVLAVNALAVNAGITLIPFVNMGGIYLAILFGLLALGSYQAMQVEAARRQPWERDWDDWRR
jgi:Zn-dependent protease